MIVRELIAKLQTLDPDAEVTVPIRVYTRAYAVANPTIDHVDKTFGGAALYVSLPKTMYVSERKEK